MIDDSNVVSTSTSLPCPDEKRRGNTKGPKRRKVRGGGEGGHESQLVLSEICLYVTFSSFPDAAAPTAHTTTVPAAAYAERWKTINPPGNERQNVHHFRYKE